MSHLPTTPAPLCYPKCLVRSPKADHRAVVQMFAHRAVMGKESTEKDYDKQLEKYILRLEAMTAGLLPDISKDLRELFRYIDDSHYYRCLPSTHEVPSLEHSYFEERCQSLSLAADHRIARQKGAIKIKQADFCRGIDALVQEMERNFR